MTDIISPQSAELTYIPYAELALSLARNIEGGGNDHIGVGVVVDPSSQAVSAVKYFDGRLTTVDAERGATIGRRTLQEHVVAFAEMLGAEPTNDELWDLQISLVTTMLAKKISDTRARALCGQLRTLGTAEESK